MLIAQRPTLTEEPVSENRSRFVLEPLEPGFGYTLGNSLRRTLLSLDPRCCCHQHPHRRRPARVHHRAGRQGGRHRPDPEPQGAGRLLRERRAGRDVPAQAGPRPGHRRRHRAARRRRDPQPRPAPRHAERQGPARDRADRRARPRLRLRRAEQAGRPGDRPHPGRLHLLAGPEGDLQGRGHPRRAAHRLRQAHPRRRDQARHDPARRGRQRRQDPRRPVRPGAGAQRARPRASTSARRRRTPRSRPTSRCRSRRWT